VEATLAFDDGASPVAFPALGAIKEATGPVELLELRRSRAEVRLLVTSAQGQIAHADFPDLPEFLRPGDVIVVNDSATIPAAVSAQLNGRRLRLHVSSPVAGTSRRLVELRLPEGIGSAPYGSARAGDIVRLPGAAHAVLVTPRLRSGRPPRLWEAELMLPRSLHKYLRLYGEPIRYGYVSHPWSLDAYQTIFARVPGSSEMPSAARPFSWQVIRRLRDAGISVVPLTLHTGVASLESDEEPYPEPFSIPRTTAKTINTAHEGRHLVLAIGTTVVRALESALDRKGRVKPANGVTDLIIEPDRRIRSVDGLLTGFHEPEASHIKILLAIGGADAVSRSYVSAVHAGYKWHEFGDVHLLITPNA
jgi:S-adenosylmethionine:tRNA ribosyltransferase-isomerase